MSFIPGQILFPILFCFFGVLLFQPTDQFTILRHFFVGNGLVIFQLPINFKQIFKHDPHAPSVQKDVVAAEHDLILLGPGFQHGNTQ